MTKQMRFDFANAAPLGRRQAGLQAYLSGAMAEDGVMLDYLARGCTLLEKRWRGQGGEIDLIFRDGPLYVICEVKKARDFDRAIERLRPAQMARIYTAAQEYLGQVPEGQLAEMRFDLALVNAHGEIRVLENPAGHF